MKSMKEKIMGANMCMFFCRWKYSNKQEVTWDSKYNIKPIIAFMTRTCKDCGEVEKLTVEYNSWYQVYQPRWESANPKDDYFGRVGE